MTTKEQQTIDNLFQLVSSLREENKKFREDVSKQVENVTTKVEQKHLPFSLEQEVKNAINTSMPKALMEALGGYNSPIQRYALNVVQKYQDSIEKTFDEIVSEAIKTDDFKKNIREALLSKIAKSMIAGVDGSVDKTIVQIKADPIFRSRLTLFVNQLVDEFLNKKSA